MITANVLAFTPTQQIELELAVFYIQYGYYPYCLIPSCSMVMDRFDEECDNIDYTLISIKPQS